MATVYTSVDIDVDIEIDEFVDSCTERDIQMLVRYLSNEGHLSKFKGIKDESKMTAIEVEYCNMLNTLMDKYVQISVEDLQTIETLYDKYR
jgi:hypothetical protein